MHSHRGAPRPTLAIVGGESLLGKEVRELLEESSLAVNIKLIASTDAPDSSIIAAGRDEPVVINSIEMADLGSAEVVVLAGKQESSRKAYEQIRKRQTCARGDRCQRRIGGSSGNQAPRPHGGAAGNGRRRSHPGDSPSGGHCASLCS